MRDPDALRARAGVRGDPRRDQHFLIDDRVLDRIPDYLEAIDADPSHVLEIGAGTGALTDRLLQWGRRVTAIERDPELAAFLREEFATAIEAERLTITEGDALEVDLPAFTCSASNLPYGVASEVLFRLLPRRRPLVAMVQREFADRMVAVAGSSDYGRLSVTAQHYGTVEVVEPVPATAFDPSPPVESAVIRVVPGSPEYEVPDEVFFLQFVTALFTQRRKTLRNAIRNTTHMTGIEDPDALLERVDPETLDRRPERIDPATFAELATRALEFTTVSDHDE